MKKWTPNTWKDYPAKHLPVYQDEKELNATIESVMKATTISFCW